LTPALTRKVTSGPGLNSAAHRAWLGSHARQLLAFYAGSADRDGGGFGILGDTGLRIPGPKHAYRTARMTYCFALGVLLGHEQCAELVSHGLSALRTIFHDDRSGGWFATVSADGREVVTPGKQTYAHAFVLLAASAAAQAGFGCDDLLGEATELFDTRLYDRDARLCLDSFDRDWRHCDPYRGMNANMHAVEALLVAHAATGDEARLRCAADIAGRLIDFAAASRWRIPEHFTADWDPVPDYNRDRPADKFRPFGATPGHSLEWARLLLQLRLAGCGPSARLLAAAQALFARALADAWDADRCGFAYTVDWDGREVIDLRLHWPLAEAIGAAQYLSDATGQAMYASWYDTFWAVARHRFIDRRNGSWQHELSTDGTASSTICSGRPDLYHALTATISGIAGPSPSLPLRLREPGAR